MIENQNNWELDDKEHKRLVGDYLRNRIKNSQLWYQAIDGGWSTSLYRYVYSVADIQAQRMLGIKNIGYSTVEIFGAGAKIDEGKIKSFLDRQCAIADGGIIDVAIPTERIESWKKQGKME